MANNSRFANSHRPAVRSIEANFEAVRRFREDLLAGRLRFTVEDVRRELRGVPLGCVCALDLPCHANLLALIANTTGPVDALAGLPGWNGWPQNHP